MSDASAVSGLGPAAQFVRWLGELGESDLKALRRATGRRRGRDVRVYDIFCGLFRQLRRKHIMARWAYYLVATLYPWHPENERTGDFGAAMRRLRPRSPDREGRARADRRFVRLLDAKGRDLTMQLAACVRALRQQGVAIDWLRLTDDLSNWYRGDHTTQHAWAESYFRS